MRPSLVCRMFLHRVCVCVKKLNWISFFIMHQIYVGDANFIILLLSRCNVVLILCSLGLSWGSLVSVKDYHFTINLLLILYITTHLAHLQVYGGTVVILMYCCYCHFTDLHEFLYCCVLRLVTFASSDLARK